jgi:alcohol dehydrogenase
LIPFDTQPRTRLVFGPGVLAQLGTLAVETGARRALVVTDPGLVRAGHAPRAVGYLSTAGLEVAAFDQVRENPTPLDVDPCVAALRAHRADLVVALGGGSAIDTAKAANLLDTNGGQMRDYRGVGRARQPLLPLLAIPTTAGTGSECQSAALIADEVTHQKTACLDPQMAPRLALLDPELTLSLPAGVTAATGIDALSHALESAVTRRRNPIAWIYAREAFRLCAGALPAVLLRPEDLAARGRMLLGAALAGLAIENSMLGAAHAAANPLTARHGMVHGLAVGRMLPHVVRFNAADPSTAATYAQLAVEAGWARPGAAPAAAADALAANLVSLLKAAGIPPPLGACGLTPDQLPALAAEAAAQWTAAFNPRPVDAAGFLALYQNAL